MRASVRLRPLAAGPGGRLGRRVVVWRSCPAHAGNEVSCRVGDVVEWPCVLCVHCMFMVEGFRWGQLKPH